MWGGKNCYFSYIHNCFSSIYESVLFRCFTLGGSYVDFQKHLLNETFEDACRICSLTYGQFPEVNCLTIQYKYSHESHWDFTTHNNYFETLLLFLIICLFIFACFYRSMKLADCVIHSQIIKPTHACYGPWFWVFSVVYFGISCDQPSLSTHVPPLCWLTGHLLSPKHNPQAPSQKLVVLSPKREHCPL